jgi:hypothetical protein
MGLIEIQAALWTAWPLVLSALEELLPTPWTPQSHPQKEEKRERHKCDPDQPHRCHAPSDSHIPRRGKRRERRNATAYQDEVHPLRSSRQSVTNGHTYYTASGLRNQFLRRRLVQANATTWASHYLLPPPRERERDRRCRIVIDQFGTVRTGNEPRLHQRVTEKQNEYKEDTRCDCRSSPALAHRAQAIGRATAAASGPWCAEVPR